MESVEVEDTHMAEAKGTPVVLEFTSQQGLLTFGTQETLLEQLSQRGCRIEPVSVTRESMET
jgi:hypothetical protein